MKKGYKDDIEGRTLANDNFREVLYTGEHIQLVLMTLQPGGEIGQEVHSTTDQFFRFESGQGKVIIDETEYEVKDGDGVIVPAGAKHNIMNTSDTEILKLYTLYAPPQHRDGIVHDTKSVAEADSEHFDGTTTE